MSDDQRAAVQDKLPERMETLRKTAAMMVASKSYVR